MTRIRFNAPPKDRLVVDDVEIWGGKTGTVTDERAAELAEASWANVSIVPDGSARWPKTHDKLDELAGQLDFTWPEPEADKPLTVAEKIAALEQAGYQPDGTKADTEPGAAVDGADDPKENE